MRQTSWCWRFCLHADCCPSRSRKLSRSVASTAQRVKHRQTVRLPGPPPSCLIWCQKSGDHCFSILDWEPFIFQERLRYFHSVSGLNDQIVNKVHTKYSKKANLDDQKLSILTIFLPIKVFKRSHRERSSSQIFFNFWWLVINNEQRLTCALGSRGAMLLLVLSVGWWNLPG